MKSKQNTNSNATTIKEDSRVQSNTSPNSRNTGSGLSVKEDTDKIHPVKRDNKSRSRANNKFRNSGKRNRSNNKDKYQDQAKSRSRSGSKNDPQWYIPNAQIVKDAASIPYAVYNGVAYNILRASDDYYKLDAQSKPSTTSPGVFTYKYLPWYGNLTPTSALNISMRALYTFVRHQNSGKTNYEAPDLMLYILAMDQIYLRVHEIRRLFGLLTMYNLKNRDLPTKIFLALGIDIGDFRANVANLRAKFNTIIAKINSFAVPKDFNLFARRAIMGTVVLSDEKDRATQIYVPSASGYFNYAINPKTSVGELQYKDKSSIMPEGYKAQVIHNNNTTAQVKATTVKEYLWELDQAINVLLTDEDMNIMSGDILKAYNSDIFELPQIDESYITEISHDVNILLQLKNSTVLDIPAGVLPDKVQTNSPRKTGLLFINGEDTVQPEPVISQSKGSLNAGVLLKRSIAGDTANYRAGGLLSPYKLLTLDKAILDTGNIDDTSPEMTMEWSRNIMLWGGENEGLATNKYIGYYELIAGTEIGLSWHHTLSTQDIGTYKLPQAQSPNPYNIELNAVHVQWLQFATIDKNVIVFDTTNPFASVYMTGTQLTTIPSDNSSVIIEPKNTIRTQTAINGLSYAPNTYIVYKVEASRTALPSVNIISDANWSKLGLHTALISRDTLRTLHDVAFLGLLGSIYLKGK